jgi:uncharacterized protein (DUF362 family)
LSFLDETRVALIKESPHYATEPPYDCSEQYPEWVGARVAKEDNPAYRGVRDVLLHLDLDRANQGSPAWNPLGDLIEPGDVVVIKPNLVAHANIGARAFGLTDTASLVTHGSVLRVVADYAAKALKGQGTIIVGDCPIQGTVWERVTTLTGLPSIQGHIRTSFPGVDFRFEDYRLATARTKGGWVAERIEKSASLSEYAEVDLGRDSLLTPLMETDPDVSFGVSQYPRRRMKAAHSTSRNAYLVAKRLLTPDVFINLPKLKAHQKAGVSCALKNLVGINGHKDYLPHFRYGSPKQGGDEYPDGNFLWDLMWRCYHAEWERDRGNAKRVFRLLSLLCAGAARAMGAPRHFTWLGGGSWHGNDTIWRTVLDLNRLFFYFDSVNGLGDKPRDGLRYLAIADGLIGAEKESPLAPSPVPSGWLLGARNPAALDAVATACMGFDIEKVKLIHEAFVQRRWPLANFDAADIDVCGNTGATALADIYSWRLFTPFNPSQGYRGAIEYRDSERKPLLPSAIAESTAAR